MKRLLAVALLLLVFAVPPVLAKSGAMTQVQQTIDKVLQLLGDKTLPDDVKKEQVSAVVRQRFAFDVMGQSALGINWRSLTPEQKEEFAAVFADLLEATYLNKIDAYTDEKVAYTNEIAKGGKVMVDTEIVTSSKRIPISYKLFSRNGDWFVYDVVIEGVSLVRNYRTTYGEIFDREGYQGLIEKMRAKLAEPTTKES